MLFSTVLRPRGLQSNNLTYQSPLQGDGLVAITEIVKSVKSVVIVSRDCWALFAHSSEVLKHTTLLYRSTTSGLIGTTLPFIGAI